MEIRKHILQLSVAQIVKYFRPFGGLTLLAFVTIFLLTGCQSKDSKIPTDSGEISKPEVQALQKQMDEQKQLLEAIRNDVSSIKNDLDGMKKAVVEAKRSPSPPPPSEDQPQRVSIDDDYLRGQTDAKVTLIEFSDFQCPFCERFFRETLPLIDQEYIRTGKVRVVYRDFPLESIHQYAMKAAEAAQCAGEQGKFWEMHDKLFNNQKALEVEHLKQYARDLGLTADRFDSCLDTGKYIEEIRKDIIDGQTVGVQGTPTFFVGLTGQGKTIQAVPIRGARPYVAFKQTIENLLQGK